MYHPGHWSVDADGLPTVAPITWRGSGDPFGLARADALIERLPGDDERPETVSFVPFGWPR